MKVSELIDFAVKGELAGLNIADISNANTERQDNIDKMISFINLGLLELYKKFQLSVGRLPVTSLANDYEFTFPDNFMAIIEAYGNDDNRTNMTINADRTEHISILESSPFTYIMYNDGEADTEMTELVVRYLRAPTLLKAATDSLPIGSQFIDALLNYMAYKANSVLNKNTETTTNPYYGKFKASCRALKDSGLLVSSSIQNTHLTDNGYV